MDHGLIEALDQLMGANGISNNELARRIEVDPAQVGRWRKGRGLPRPENLIRVAAVFGVEYDWLLGLAYPEVRNAAPEPDLIETAIRARAGEMREAVQDIPREFWATIIKATFDRAIDGARDMAALLTEHQSAPRSVRSPGEAPIRSRHQRANSHASSGADEIASLSLHRGLLLATP